MDIRSFFGGKKSVTQQNLPRTNVSADVGNPPLPDSTSKLKKRSQKVEVSKSEQNKKHSGKPSVAVVDLSDSDDSEGESPIPASLRKVAEKQKRSRERIVTDSDEDIPRRKATHRQFKSATPSPVKTPIKTKRSRVLVYDSDETGSPTPKKQKVKQKPQKLASDSDDVEFDSETDSEDEFKEKKRQRKKAAQSASKKLQLDKVDGKPTSEKADKVSEAKSAASGRRTIQSSSSKKQKDQCVSDRKAKVSPSQKENAHERRPERPQEKGIVLEVDDDAASQKRVNRAEVSLTGGSKKSVGLKQDERKQKVSPQNSQNAKTPLRDLDQKKHSKEQAHVYHKIEKGEIFVPWVDKYRPKSISHLVGQNGDKSPMNKLLSWLKDWACNNLGEGGKVKKAKPPPFMAQMDGAPFKAVLLSGSPGVGKTTCAVMACEILGLKMVEMNASDVRSKKSLEQHISQLTDSHQIEEYFTAMQSSDDNEVKHVLIMDEVDGMSGTEDRAGIAELIQIIKDSKIPIICICNDRQHTKIRSLANYCYDVRFQKPRVEQIRARLMSIVCQEKLKISKEELDQMIELSGHDVRQSIYNLQLHASAGGKTQVQKKDVAVGPFEAARKLLDSRSSLQEKQDMFFVDYGIMPLFVQENYPNMRNDKHTPKQAFAGLRKAADLISHGDTIERCVRSSGSWKLLNEQGIIGCALPSIAVGGHLRAMIQFPAWLGKNSTSNKRHRLVRQLATHSQLKISADLHSLVADYVPVLRDCLTKPLLERESDGVFEVVCLMNDYDLIREDSEAVSELAVWPGKIDPASKILPKVKAALTRALNKEHRMLPYQTEDIAKGRRKPQQVDYEFELDEEGNVVEKVDGEDSGYEDNSEDEDYKPGSKSKGKSKATPSAARGRGRGASAVGTSRGGAKRGRGK